MSIFSKKILPATDGSKEAKLALRLGVRASVVWGHCHGSRLMSWQDYYHPRRFGRARAVLSIFSNEKLGLIAGQVRKDLSHVVEEIANS